MCNYLLSFFLKKNNQKSNKKIPINLYSLSTRTKKMLRNNKRHLKCQNTCLDACLSGKNLRY